MLAMSVSADSSVNQPSVMMAPYRSYVVFVLLFTVHSAHSVRISGTIYENTDEPPRQLKVSNYVTGDDYNDVRSLSLNRLLNADTLPTLKLANFQSIYSLELTNISLENVPVFKNTICNIIHITENKIKRVPANAFSAPQPSYLDLTNNQIQRMADRSVNAGANHVILACNKLTRFSQSWFEDPGSILTLDLGANRIEYIQDRAFDQMTRLSLLDVSYNHLTRIGREAFSSVITDLRLNFNDITQLTADMFARRRKFMSVLFLHHNQLSYLPEALWLRLKPKRISLQGNPWQCECLRDIERWLRGRKSERYHIPSRRDEPVCVVPRNYTNVCMPAVDTELQETYAQGLSPMQGCLASRCKPCHNLAETNLQPFI